MNLQLLMLAEIVFGELPTTLVGLLFCMFWIAMLVDCVNHEPSDKIGWILVMVLFSVIGALLYFLLRLLPRRRAQRHQPASQLYQPWKKDKRIG